MSSWRFFYAHALNYALFYAANPKATVNERGEILHGFTFYLIMSQKFETLFIGIELLATHPH